MSLVWACPIYTCIIYDYEPRPTSKDFYGSLTLLSFKIYLYLNHELSKERLETRIDTINKNIHSGAICGGILYLLWASVVHGNSKIKNKFVILTINTLFVDHVDEVHSLALLVRKSRVRR